MLTSSKQARTRLWWLSACAKNRSLNFTRMHVKNKLVPDPNPHRSTERRSFSCCVLMLRTRDMLQNDGEAGNTVRIDSFCRLHERKIDKLWIFRFKIRFELITIITEVPVASPSDRRRMEACLWVCCSSYSPQLGSGGTRPCREPQSRRCLRIFTALIRLPRCTIA